MHSPKLLDRLNLLSPPLGQMLCKRRKSNWNSWSPLPTWCHLITYSKIRIGTVFQYSLLLHPGVHSPTSQYFTKQQRNVKKKKQRKCKGEYFLQSIHYNDLYDIYQYCSVDLSTLCKSILIGCQKFLVQKSPLSLTQMSKVVSSLHW